VGFGCKVKRRVKTDAGTGHESKFSSASSGQFLPGLLSKKSWVCNFEQLPGFPEIKMVVWIWPVLSDL
jgi:hypothetical protein